VTKVASKAYAALTHMAVIEQGTCLTPIQGFLVASQVSSLWSTLRRPCCTYPSDGPGKWFTEHTDVPSTSRTFDRSRYYTSPLRLADHRLDSTMGDVNSLKPLHNFSPVADHCAASPVYHATNLYHLSRSSWRTVLPIDQLFKSTLFGQATVSGSRRA